MIFLDRNRLMFRFPEVHEDAICSIELQRTLRIPDDDKDYPLPPGLGAFELRHLDDYSARLPQSWCRRGGVIAPMHQAEAMWINFTSDYPFAVKVATGKICAITGDAWTNHLNCDPQDYAVLPDQPWLDGYSVEKGIIRQFVAMPLGGGYTVEEQLTEAAVHGGIQFVVYPIKAERYHLNCHAYRLRDLRSFPSASMGLAPGGRMKQDIYDDRRGLDVWDQRHGSRCFVSLVNTAQWMAITGERPPTDPPTARAYTARGLPWFDYYDGDSRVMAGSKKLRNLKSVAKNAEATSQSDLPDNETILVPNVIALGKPGRRPVRESAGDESVF